MSYYTKRPFQLEASWKVVHNVDIFAVCYQPTIFSTCKPIASKHFLPISSKTKDGADCGARKERGSFEKNEKHKLVPSPFN